MARAKSFARDAADQARKGSAQRLLEPVFYTFAIPEEMCLTLPCAWIHTSGPSPAFMPRETSPHDRQTPASVHTTLFNADSLRVDFAGDGSP